MTIADPRVSTYTIKKKKRQSCCRRACLVILILVLVLFVVGAGLFAAAEFTSRPGYYKPAQDSPDLMARIQQTRASMPQVAARIQSGQAKLTKQEVIDHLQRATAFSAAAYTATYAPQECPYPVGANLSRAINTSQARVMIARDDIAQQVVVAFKGLSGPADYLRSLKTSLQPLSVAAITAPIDARVETGIQEMYLSVERAVLDTVNSELTKSTNYSVLVTGHNTGGSMAVLAGLSMKSTFPSTTIMVVTQGQPRTFNQAGADYIDQIYPPASQTLFRAVHSLDGVPTISSPFVNSLARHHSGEIWQFQDPALPDNVVICTAQEDPTCSSSNASPIGQVAPPALFYNAESVHYLDIEMNSKSSKHCGLSGGQFQFGLLTSRFSGQLKVQPSREVIARQ